MKNKLILTSLILSIFCSGCAAVIIGGAAVYAGKKILKRRPKLTEMQRRALESKDVEGTREDVLRSIVTVFQDYGYSVQSSDYVGGIIAAGTEKPFIQITASVEQFTEDIVKMRVTIKDKDGVIEDAKVFSELFDKIQAEVFRRVNLSK